MISARRMLVCVAALALLGSARSSLASEWLEQPPGAAPKELSADAKRLLLVLEPFTAQARQCNVLSGQADAAITKALQLQFAVEDTPSQKTTDKKAAAKAAAQAAAARDQAMVDSKVQTEAATKCWDALKSQTTPALDAASAPAEARAEAWSAWIEKIQKTEDAEKDTKAAVAPSTPKP